LSRLGIIKFNDECIKQKKYTNSKHIKDCLNQEISENYKNECGCKVTDLLCLSSTMYYPWKHSEIEWNWRLENSNNKVVECIQAFLTSIEKRLIF